MSFRGAAAAHEAHVAGVTPRCMKHPCKQRKRARCQLWLHAVGSQSYATRLRRSCDRDLITCSLHFYSAVEAAMPHHWQSPYARDRGDGSLQAKRPRTKGEQNSIKAAVGDTPLSLNQLSVLNERHGVKPLSLVGGCYALRVTMDIKRSSLNAMRACLPIGLRHERACGCGECVIVARRSVHMRCEPHVINQRSPPSL